MDRSFNPNVGKSKPRRKGCNDRRIKDLNRRNLLLAFVSKLKYGGVEIAKE